MKSHFKFKTLASVAFCLLVAFFPQHISAQKKSKKQENLVQNPGFEEITPGKTATLSNGIDVAANWNSPNQGGSLLYTTDKQYIYDPNGSSWPFKARNGKNVAGMNVYGGYGGAERREYIQGMLKEPLTVGRKYFFEFYVHYHCEGANNIGIAFLPEKINVAESGLLKLQPVSHQKEVTPYNNDKKTWTLVRDTFVAVRPYQSFVIGNFFPNSETKVESSKYGHYFAYIDDIVVAETADQPEVPPVITTADEQKWNFNTEATKNVDMLIQKPEPVKQTMKVEEVSVKTVPAVINVPSVPEPPAIPAPPPAPIVNLVQFKGGSAELSPESQSALDGLALQMAQNTALKLHVKGFASSEGSTLFNQQLSERRAKSVQEYLSAKGVDGTRISIEALGEKQPVASNDNPEERSKNRRVELGWSEN